MNNEIAEIIGKKARALKHCNKLLKEIDKHGKMEVPLGNTGVVFVVHKNDAIYTRIQSTKFQLLDEINSYEITQRESVQRIMPARRTAPAPVGAAPIEELSETQRAEIAKERQKAYNKTYREKLRTLGVKRLKDLKK